jgi:hypothetical protein
MIGAARLDARIYEDIEADPKRTAASVFVVVIASVGAAIGTGNTGSAVIGITLAALLSWIVWILLTLVIGVRLMPGPDTHADVGQIMRTTGFSSAPGVLRVLGAIPVIGWPIFLAVTFWMLLTFVVAIRHALDYDSFARAFAVCLLGWIIHGLLFFGLVLVAI